MDKMKSNTGTAFWIGVRCRNPGCNKDFVVSDKRGSLISEREDSPDAEKLGLLANSITGRLAPMLDAVATLYGARTSTLANVNVAQAIHHCPHCGRGYMYLFLFPYDRGHPSRD